jgi:uncharacterized membrane protein HdeD (DUF308 family)
MLEIHRRRSRLKIEEIERIFPTSFIGSRIMSTASTNSPSLGHELHSVRDQWWCFLAMGIALVVLGAISICLPWMATLTSVIVFGFLLLAAGVTQVVSSFWSGKWSGMLLHLLVGVLYMVVGFMMLDAPMENALLLTKLIAIFLIVTGIFDIVGALAHRFHGWAWVLLNGCVTLMLGLLINKGWPANALWVIGLFVGIEMILNGWGWIMLSLGLKASKRAA